jgi:hypothetical protein
MIQFFACQLDISDYIMPDYGLSQYVLQMLVRGRERINVYAPGSD